MEEGIRHSNRDIAKPIFIVDNPRPVIVIGINDDDLVFIDYFFERFFSRLVCVFKEVLVSIMHI